MLALQETIRPSADLRNHYNEISKQCREDNEARIPSSKSFNFCNAILFPNFSATYKMMLLTCESAKSVRTEPEVPSETPDPADPESPEVPESPDDTTTPEA